MYTTVTLRHVTGAISSTASRTSSSGETAVHGKGGVAAQSRVRVRRRAGRAVHPAHDRVIAANPALCTRNRSMIARPAAAGPRPTTSTREARRKI